MDGDIGVGEWGMGRLWKRGRNKGEGLTVSVWEIGGNLEVPRWEIFGDLGWRWRKRPIIFLRAVDCCL